MCYVIRLFSASLTAKGKQVWFGSKTGFEKAVCNKLHTDGSTVKNLKSCYKLLILSQGSLMKVFSKYYLHF